MPLSVRLKQGNLTEINLQTEQSDGRREHAAPKHKWIVDSTEQWDRCLTTQGHWKKMCRSGIDDLITAIWIHQKGKRSWHLTIWQAGGNTNPIPRLRWKAFDLRRNIPAQNKPEGRRVCFPGLETRHLLFLLKCKHFVWCYELFNADFFICKLFSSVFGSGSAGHWAVGVVADCWRHNFIMHGLVWIKTMQETFW